MYFLHNYSPRDIGISHFGLSENIQQIKKIHHVLVKHSDTNAKYDITANTTIDFLLLKLYKEAINSAHIAVPKAPTLRNIYATLEYQLDGITFPYPYPSIKLYIPPSNISIYDPMRFFQTRLFLKSP